MMQFGLIFTHVLEKLVALGCHSQGEWHCCENNTAVTQGLLGSEDGGSSCFQKTSVVINPSLRT